MRTLITKEFSFHAAHQLHNHAGKCSRPHGHTYRVELGIVGAPHGADGSSGEGMVLDFDRIKAVWATNLEPFLDHQDLNVTLGMDIGPTTCENIAAWICEQFVIDIEGADPQRNAEHWYRVHHVRVWETETSSATVWL